MSSGVAATIAFIAANASADAEGAAERRRAPGFRSGTDGPAAARVAPIAARTATSRARDAARAISRLAMLMQAMSSSKPDRGQHDIERRPVVADDFVVQTDARACASRDWSPRTPPTSRPVSASSSRCAAASVDAAAAVRATVSMKCAPRLCRVRSQVNRCQRSVSPGNRTRAA